MSANIEFAAKKRDSNIELLRIFAMLVIIAHHFVINSGVVTLFDYSHPTTKLLWMQFLGAWGKTAINSFVLITGYFMCASNLTVRRFLKLFMEVFFYNIFIYLLFIACGNEVLSLRGVVKVMIWPLYGINRGFTTSFLWFYLFIPFYNLFIRASTRRQLFEFVGLLLVMFVVSSTFFFNTKVFHYVMWYMVLYFVGAIVRIYPLRWMNSIKFCTALFSISLMFVVLWMCFTDWSLMKYGHGFGGLGVCVGESNRLFAFLIGLSAFLMFKNMKIGYNRFINVIASTTFGVLLIHTHSHSMRLLLWRKIVDVQGHYQSLSTVSIVSYSLFVVCAVFVVCCVIDIFRQLIVEKPFFAVLAKLRIKK